MRGKRLAALLLGLGAIGGVAAGEASANASFYECVKNKAGGFSDKGCTVEGSKHHFELREGIGKGKPFKGKGVAVSMSVPALGKEMTCTASKSVLSVESPHDPAGTGSLTWSGCQIEGASCRSTGEKKPGVVEAELVAEFGTLEESKALNARPFAAGDGIGGVSVGLKKKPGGQLSVQCGAGGFTVNGAAIGEVSEDVGQISKTSEWTFALEKGVQRWGAFLGGPPEHLEVTVEGFGSFEAALSMAIANKGEALELKV